MSLPQHIAIIPDGNRRWAKDHALAAFFGHREGAKVAEKILQTALDAGIKYFTFWGASVDNVTKRDHVEVQFLFEIFEDYFKRLLKDEKVHEKKVRINVWGEWSEYFPESCKKAILQVIEATKEYNQFQANFLLAYSGVSEMVRAVRGVVEQVQSSKLEVSTDLIKSNLYTQQLPPVDLVIRTGGEPHLSSGFMMWDVADAQLYFSENMWPAFSVEEFKRALDEYGERERRLGK